jgi:hypothetical protein
VAVELSSGEAEIRRRTLIQEDFAGDEPVGRGKDGEVSRSVDGI